MNDNADFKGLIGWLGADMDVKKIAKVSGAIAFFVLVYGMFAMRQYYTRHMPIEPQLGMGRTFPMEVNYGRVVYVTVAEKQYLDFAYIGATVAGVLFVAIAAVKIRKPSKD